MNNAMTADATASSTPAKRPWLAALLNFFLPGAGYLYAGRKGFFAIAWLIGAIGLTYVETTLKGIDINLYWAMFASVFVLNTAFAIDAFRDAKQS